MFFFRSEKKSFYELILSVFNSGQNFVRIMAKRIVKIYDNTKYYLFRNTYAVLSGRKKSKISHT